MHDRFTTVILAGAAEGDVAATHAALVETLGSIRFESVVVRPGTTAPGAALNRSLSATRNPIVAYFIAGARPEPYWYVGAAEGLERSDVGAVVPRIVDGSGAVVRACGIGVANGALEASFGGFARDAIHALRPRVAELGSLCGLCVERTRLEAVTGFDPLYDATLYDYDLTLRIRRSGGALFYRPDVTVRFDGVLADGETPAERSSARRFVEVWRPVVGPHLRSAAFSS